MTLAKDSPTTLALEAGKQALLVVEAERRRRESRHLCYLANGILHEGPPFTLRDDSLT